MTIRVRLTVLVAVMTAVLSGLGLWLGLSALRDFAHDRAIDPMTSELDFWFELVGNESVVIVDGPEVESESFMRQAIGEELQALFATDDEFLFALSASTTVQLVDEFGVDGRLYVSPIGLTDPGSDVNELAWPVSRSGIVGTAVETRDLPNGVSLVPVVVLFDLVDPDPFDDLDIDDLEAQGGDVFIDESGDVVFVEGVALPRDLQLVFGEVFFDDTRYGLVADATDEFAAIDAVGGFLWTTAAVLVVLAALSTWVVSGRALAPVGAMIDEVEVLSSTKLNERLPGADRADEIGHLALTLNQMLDRLEASDRQRRRFVSDASHELRTPLAVLVNQAEVARSAPESTSLDALAEIVEGETTRLSSVVEDLLLLARHDELSATTGGVASRTATAEFDFDDVVLAEIARPRLLPVDRSAISAGRVKGDPVAAARAVGHLLDNAARHGNSTIAVALATVGDEVHLVVDDDGDGIAEPDSADVFERFTRLDESRTRDSGGAGLGLSVVKATFATMGGTVSVSRSPLGGARFSVVLPAV